MSRHRPVRTRQARARMALAAIALWLAGFEVLPWMHIALHDHVGTHHHDASGAIVLDRETTAAPHHHHDHADDHSNDDDLDAEVDEHGAPVEHVAQLPDREDREDHADHHDQLAAIELVKQDARTHLADALAHGRHSLAHHDLAMQPPAAVVTSPVPVDRRPETVAIVVSIEPISLSPGRAVARGPPVNPSV